jgi:hypothetical protein
VAFYGFENPILTAYSQKVFLYSTDTTYCKTYSKSGQYYINPYYKFGNDTCVLLVKTHHGKTLKTIEQIKIPVKVYSPGRASIGENRNYISKELLMAADSLFLIPEQDYFSQSAFKIIKYRVIILPKAGYLLEMSCNSDKIPKQLKDLFEKLSPGDMVVFDGIRAKSYNNSIEKPISPFAITLSAKSYNAHASNFRINGFVKQSNGQITPYIYPKSSNEELLKDIVKDSTWQYYEYDYVKDTFQLDMVETYKNGIMRSRTVYQYDSFCHHYTLKCIDDGGDSLYGYEQYYSNGQLYQKGMVVCNTRYSEYRHFKYSNEENLTKNKPYNTALKHLPSEAYHPFGYWQVYDRSGYLSMSLDWAFLQDTSYVEGCGFIPDDPILEYIQKKYYYSIPKGDISLYNEKGDIIERLFPEE